MEVTVSVATEWNNNQLPIPTTRKIGHRAASRQDRVRDTFRDGEPERAFMCVDSFSVNRTVKSLIGEVFQLLELAPSACERYVLKLCDSEEYLQR